MLHFGQPITQNENVYLPLARYSLEHEVMSIGKPPFRRRYAMQCDREALEPCFFREGHKNRRIHTLISIDDTQPNAHCPRAPNQWNRTRQCSHRDRTRGELTPVLHAGTNSALKQWFFWFTGLDEGQNLPSFTNIIIINEWICSPLLFILWIFIAPHCIQRGLYSPAHRHTNRMQNQCNYFRQCVVDLRLRVDEPFVCVFFFLFFEKGTHSINIDWWFGVRARSSIDESQKIVYFCCPIVRWRKSGTKSKRPQITNWMQP